MSVLSADKLKPCVSHRDMNTRNILVKVDLSCCLCDLGFAMKISGSKYFYNGEEQHAETKSINDVIYTNNNCLLNFITACLAIVSIHVCLIYINSLENSELLIFHFYSVPLHFPVWCEFSPNWINFSFPLDCSLKFIASHRNRSLDFTYTYFRLHRVQRISAIFVSAPRIYACNRPNSKFRILFRSMMLKLSLFHFIFPIQFEFWTHNLHPYFSSFVWFFCSETNTNDLRFYQSVFSYLDKIIYTFLI